MNVLALLIGFIFPACASVGAAGVPVPPPGELAHLVRPSTPNSALVGPAGFTPQPDLVLPPYPVPPARLYAALRAVAAGQERTFLQAEDPATMEVRYVVRSAVLNFPDLIVAQVSSRAEDSSALVLYSRSLYGRSDLGVNRARIAAWIAALDAMLRPPNRS